MKWLWTLRAAAAILLMVLIMKPVATRPDPALSQKWAVLLDTSKSMAIKDPETRLEREKKVARQINKSISNAHFYRFDEQLQAVDSHHIDTLQPNGTKSNLALALSQVFSTADFKGAILLTDGRQVGSGDPISAAAVAGKPLLSIGFGSHAAFKDASVKNIQAPPFAFKNIQTGLNATVAAAGYQGQTLVVKLMEAQQVLSMQNVAINKADFETTVSFSWTPARLGSQILKVEISPLAGEVTTANNKKEVSLEVGRDKFRVLYICGKPGPEYGFLRYQFKSDPAVELVTFVILRNAMNAVNVSENELSLIPFPTQDVLINQIASFDLIVFEEFPFWEFGLQTNLISAIRRRVENGGSFLLTGGPTVFSAQSLYALPELQAMIPVEFSNDIRVTETPAQFLPSAQLHPILRVDQDSQRNADLWNSVAPLEDVALLPRVKPGATVVGSVKVGNQTFPVLTVWKFGKGRVGALSTRTTWRWSLVPSKKEQGATLYQQFWKNMVLWLTHADEYKTVRVSIEAKPVRLAEPAPLRLWVTDEYFKPLTDADVKVQIEGPDQFSNTPSMSMEAPGVFLGSVTPEKLGAHTIRAWVFRKGKKYGEDSASFRVVESQLEEEDLSPDFELLRELGDVTGGRFMSEEDFSPQVLSEFNKEMDKKSGRKVLLWNSPWLFAAVFGLLGVEWFLRKRKGLP